MVQDKTPCREEAKCMTNFRELRELVFISEIINVIRIKKNYFDEITRTQTIATGRLL